MLIFYFNDFISVFSIECSRNLFTDVFSIPRIHLVLIRTAGNNHPICMLAVILISAYCKH